MGEHEALEIQDAEDAVGFLQHQAARLRGASVTSALGIIAVGVAANWPVGLIVALATVFALTLVLGLTAIRVQERKATASLAELRAGSTELLDPPEQTR